MAKKSRKEIEEWLSALDSQIAKDDLDANDLPKNLESIFLKETGMSINEARRMVEYVTMAFEGDIAAMSGQGAKQVAQGATWGLGDQIAGIGGLFTGEGYHDAQQRHKAGIEEYRRVDPMQAALLEAAGSAVTIPAGGFALGKAGLKTGGLLAQGMAHANPLVRGGASAASTAAQGMVSSSGKVRALSSLPTGVAGGALYGADTNLGATGGGGFGGVINAGLYASPYGRWLAKSAQNRTGSITRGVPSKDADLGPGTFRSGLLERAKAYIPDGKEGGIDLQTPLRQTFERRTVTAADEAAEAAQKIISTTGRRSQIQPSPKRNPTTGLLEEGTEVPLFDIIGPGTQHWSQTSTNIGKLLELPGSIKGQLDELTEKVSKEAYGPLDDLFSSGFRATNNNIDELNRLHTGADKLTVRGVNDVVDGEINELRKLIFRIEGNETTKGLFTKANVQLRNNPNATVTIRKIVQGEPTPAGKPGPFKVVKEVKNIAKWTADDVLEKSDDPAYLAKFLDDLGWNANKGEFIPSNPGQLPDLRSMQQLRNTLRTKAGDPGTGSGGSEHARMVLAELEGVMERLYPGLNQADAMFRHAKILDDVANLATNRSAGKFNLQKIPEPMMKDIDAILNPLSKPEVNVAMQNVLKYVTKDARNPKQAENITRLFKDRWVQHTIIGPMQKGKEEGVQAASKMVKYFDSDEGRALLEGMIEIPNGLKSQEVRVFRQKAREQLMEGLRLLSLETTKKEGMSLIRYALIGVVGGAATVAGGSWAYNLIDRPNQTSGR